MYSQAAAVSSKIMTFDRMLESVRYEGAYPTRERAEESVRTVLTALGRQLPGAERAALAARLPAEAARLLTSGAQAEPLTGQEFVKALVARTGGTTATTRWDTSTVLTLVGHLAGGDVLAQVLARLPQGYALLFGRAELTQAARRGREGTLATGRHTLPRAPKPGVVPDVATAGC